MERPRIQKGGGGGGGGGYWEVVSDVFLVNFQPFVLNSRSAILLKGRKWHFICESQLSVMI